MDRPIEAIRNENHESFRTRAEGCPLRDDE